MLEVNLSAMIHNLNVYNKMLRPGVKIMAMVKAAGYGSGSSEVAKLLEFHRLDYLGVAYNDEGIELRQAGIKMPILVLNPERSGFDALTVRCHLACQVAIIVSLRQRLAGLRRLGAASRGRPVRRRGCRHLSGAGCWCGPQECGNRDRTRVLS